LELSSSEVWVSSKDPNVGYEVVMEKPIQFETFEDSDLDKAVLQKLNSQEIKRLKYLVMKLNL
jgi:hypothetical protein